MYNVVDICSYVINYCNSKGYSISNLKLQKLLYFIQAYFLVTTSRPCFKETIEAWDFGPVVPKAYREYKLFGNANIPDVSARIGINRDDEERIQTVVDACSEFSSTDLVRVTQNQEPWKRAYFPGAQKEITQQSIREYFSA